MDTNILLLQEIPFHPSPLVPLTPHVDARPLRPSLTASPSSPLCRLSLVPSTPPPILRPQARLARRPLFPAEILFTRNSESEAQDSNYPYIIKLACVFVCNPVTMGGQMLGNVRTRFMRDLPRVIDPGESV